MGNQLGLLDETDPGASRPTEQHLAEIGRKLAIKYSDDQDIPARYRGGTTDRALRRKARKDALIEDRFNRRVGVWQVLVKDMYTTLSASQVARFVSCTPSVDQGTTLAGCADFSVFLDYLIERRDNEGCCGEELGCLCALVTEFQHAVESAIEAHEQDA